MEFSKTTGESVSYSTIQVGAQQGWQCPICKRINAPWVAQCPCNGWQEWTETHLSCDTNGCICNENETIKIHHKDYEPVKWHMGETEGNVFVKYDFGQTHGWTPVLREVNNKTKENANE